MKMIMYNPENCSSRTDRYNEQARLLGFRLMRFESSLLTEYNLNIKK